MYVYIYIYRERERYTYGVRVSTMCIYIYTYVYIYIYIYIYSGRRPRLASKRLIYSMAERRQTTHKSVLSLLIWLVSLVLSLSLLLYMVTVIWSYDVCFNSKRLQQLATEYGNSKQLQNGNRVVTKCGNGLPILREFTKGGSVKGGLAIYVLSLCRYCWTPLY